MEFVQSPPSLENQFDDDRVLRAYLRRALPYEVLCDVEGTLRAMGALAAGPLYARLLSEGTAEPRLTHWSAWGERVDRIDLTPLWKDASRIALDFGLVATAYERKFGAYSRLVQFALVYLFDASTAVYTCPLAMTDGAAKTLSSSKNAALIERAVPRLVSRDPHRAWTSGQWMTERTGGSDVGISETRAVAEGQHHRLFGTKWFTSATTSEMALTLARPEGNPPGGRGLALFYVETRRDDGTLNGIRIHRLKDKLGTRMVPTAELGLEGALATAVSGTSNGVKAITPMLAITRTWNAVCAVAGMRRAIALARSYAAKRVAFGAQLMTKPLHADTLASMQAEFEGAFALAFRVVELLGREEAGEASAEQTELLRLLTPLAKLATGKQAVAVASEALECFGGAGYVEDTGLPRLLRDAQVLPIWEGTTNVLSLDLLRALATGASLETLAHEVRRATQPSQLHPELGPMGREVSNRLAAITSAFEALVDDPPTLEANARRFALGAARCLSLALMIEAAFAERSDDPRPLYAARRFAMRPVEMPGRFVSNDESQALSRDVGLGGLQ